ncbi:MAG: hypothetical protein EAX81_03195 [Candidatus Thorarchaeota archaeon]|nr:hypothetical protein [Candidatus Thorarchaeota archaeon]
MNASNNTAITTRDIVTIAMLSSLGGALSTFVGYLGNLINLSLGIPFGAGQFMAGLHVFWIVLMRVLVPKTGVGLAGGALKGLVELFTGSTHGIVIVLVSLIQGLIIDVGASSFRELNGVSVSSQIVWWVTAGFSSASNVLVFQALYFTGAPIVYIAVMTILAFCSGVIFAGYFAWETLEFLNEIEIIPANISSREPSATPRRKLIVRNFPAVAFLTFIIVGSVYFTVFVAVMQTDPYSCEVTGLVENPYTYHQSNFVGQEVTIEAELIGAYTHLDPANYTGILLGTILNYANPNSGATTLRVSARDGYTVLFDFDSVVCDNRMLLTESEDGLWLIAGDYDGALWVRWVTVLEVF